jgi:hypothetical protein
MTKCQDVRLMTKQYYENHNQKPKEEAPRPTGEAVESGESVESVEVWSEMA